MGAGWRWEENIDSVKAIRGGEKRFVAGCGIGMEM